MVIRKGSRRPVVAVNPDGSVAGYFDMIKDASMLYKIDRHSIIDSCRKGTISRGLKWFYEEDFRRIYENCEFEKLRYTLDPNRNRITYHFKPGHKQNVGVKWSEQRKKEASERRRILAARRKELGLYEQASRKLYKEVINIDDGRVFPSVKACAEFYGIPRHYISGCLHRAGKCRGMRFRLKAMWDKV